MSLKIKKLSKGVKKQSPALTINKKVPKDANDCGYAAYALNQECTAYFSEYRIVHAKERLINRQRDTKVWLVATYLSHGEQLSLDGKVYRMYSGQIVSQRWEGSQQYYVWESTPYNEFAFHCCRMSSKKEEFLRKQVGDILKRFVNSNCYFI